MIELVLQKMSDSGVHVEDPTIIQDAEDTIKTVRKERQEIRNALESLQVAMESCSIVKLHKAILEAERFSLPIEIKSTKLRKAKEMIDAMKTVEVKYNDINTELKDALKVENLKLMRMFSSSLSLYIYIYIA